MSDKEDAAMTQGPIWPSRAFISGIILGSVLVGTLWFAVGRARPEYAQSDGAASEQASSQHAKDALHEAEKLRASKPELAAILYLNAFNADPSEVKALEGYLDLVASGDTSSEVIQQAASMLDVALYKVPAKAVSELLERRKALEQRLSASNPVDAAITEEMPSVSTLLESDNEILLNDSEALADFFATAERVMDALASREDDDGAEANRNALAEKIDVLQRSQEVNQSLGRVEVFANRASEFADKRHLQMAAMLLNAAENGLVQSAALCDATMPTQVLANVDKLQSELSALSARVGDLHAVAALDEIRKASDQVQQLASAAAPPFAAHCKAIETAIHQVQPSLAHTSDATRFQATELFGAMQQSLAELRRKQHIEYNRWVLGQCQEAVASINAQWYKSSEDAVRVFADAKLDTVDETLLSPETARLFSEVIGKLMNKMSAAHVAEHQNKLTLTLKRRLEEF
jgi:hypothetical protein